jgi:hypothetical protein
MLASDFLMDDECSMSEDAAEMPLEAGTEGLADAEAELIGVAVTRGRAAAAMVEEEEDAEQPPSRGGPASTSAVCGTGTGTTGDDGGDGGAAAAAGSQSDDVQQQRVLEALAFMGLAGPLAGSPPGASSLSAPFPAAHDVAPAHRGGDAACVAVAPGEQHTASGETSGASGVSCGSAPRPAGQPFDYGTGFFDAMSTSRQQTAASGELFQPLADPSDDSDEWAIVGAGDAS